MSKIATQYTKAVYVHFCKKKVILSPSLICDIHIVTRMALLVRLYLTKARVVHQYASKIFYDVVSWHPVGFVYICNQWEKGI